MMDVMTIEEEILEATYSLRSVMNGILRGRRWENWTFQYAEMDKEEMIRKAKKAFQKITFQPPEKMQ